MQIRVLIDGITNINEFKKIAKRIINCLTKKQLNGFRHIILYENYPYPEEEEGIITQMDLNQYLKVVV